MAGMLHLVGFKNNDDFFGIPIDRVREIVRVPEVTAVPESPDFYKGVINLRGRIVPVIDMSRRLGKTPSGEGKANRILVLELGGGLAGLLVDSVSEIVKMEKGAIEPPPEAVSNAAGSYVAGVGRLKDRLILLLNIDELLNPGGAASRARPVAATGGQHQVPAA